MKIIPITAALIVSLLLAYLLGESLIGYAAFAIAGALGGWIAGYMQRGSERLYWGFVFLTLALFVITVFVVSLDKLIVILPLVLTLGYFVARLTGRVTGQRGSLPS